MSNPSKYLLLSCTALIIGIQLLTTITPVSCSSGAKILFYFAWSSYSNKLAVWPLVEKLAERNHSITFLSPHLPTLPSISKVTEFRPKGLVKYFRQHEENLFQDLISLKIKSQREGESLKDPREAMIVEACGVTFKSADFKPWVERSKFDLVVIDSPMNECGMALAFKLKAPFVFYVSSGLLEPWQAEAFGINDEHFPGITKDENNNLHVHNPNIWDRFVNNISPVWSYYTRAYYLLPKLEKLSKKWLELPSIPTFTEFEKNASLILFNGHPSVEAAKPLPPFFIPVGGMRCASSKDALSDDLAKFLTDKCQDGFIYINFGTMVDFYKAPDVVVTKFFDALRNVNMPILWKWGSKAMPANAPENVFFASWIPQNAVLGHPKLKVFIYHGGPLSTQEAIYHSVPVIVFPLTTEAERQARIIEHFGIGIKLEIALFTQYELTTSIRSILKDNSYRKKSIKLGGLYKDRSQDPRTTAVWWIEYVLRHQGAHFLKPQSTMLLWHQRRLLDAWGLLLLTTTLGLYALFKLITFLSTPKSKPITQPSAQAKRNPAYLKNKDKLSGEYSYGSCCSHTSNSSGTPTANSSLLTAAESPPAASTIIMHKNFDIYSTMSETKDNLSLTDATLRTSDGFSFPVHRHLLCTESDYFKALFTTSLHPSPLTDVVVYNIRGDMLSLLLDFMYTREMWLSEDNVISIFEAADYLSLIKIRNKCCEFIENQLEELNCLGIRRFARDWFCPDLERTAHQYIMRNFVDVAKISGELLELTMPEVSALFSDDELNVKNEEVVWEAALRWIKHDEQQRRLHIVDLLRTVRTGLMDTQYFMEKVKESHYVQGHEGCRPIVIETLRFLYDLEVITERDGEIPTPSIARPRIPHEILFAIGGWSGGSPTSFIETYDTRADRWIRVQEVDPMGPRAYHGTVAIGFKIYVIGGFDGVDYFSSCRVFDAVTKHWKYIAPMYNRRCYVSVALLDNDKIYAMGGYDGQHRQNSCERYDPVLNQWSQICPMNCQRSDASATALRNIIYICGGFNGVECLNSCECYDPEINQWTMILPMRSRRSGVSCIAYNEHVYVVGGFNGVSRMCSGEKYNPDTNTWTTIPDMYNPRSNFAIEVIDDLLFCIGGFTGTSTTFNVECFDQKTNEWYEATDMNIYRSALAACVIPGLPNTKDYIHPHRDRLMEEKRQRLLVLQQQQGSYVVDNNQNQTDQQQD